MNKIILFSLTLASLMGSTKAQVNMKYLNPANIDKNVNLGNDFYNHFNGTWLTENPVPASEVIWGSFQMLRDKTLADQKKILDELEKSKVVYKKGSNEQKLRDFYLAGMNEKAINAAGLNPIRPMLKEIEACKNNDELFAKTIQMYRKGLGEGFNFYINVDDKNVNRMLPQFSQGGLGLPDRDYYFNEGEKFENIRNQYKEYIYKMLNYINGDNVNNKLSAEKIFNHEKTLASSQMTRVEMRDPNKTYNLFTIDELSQKIPVFNWNDLLMKLGVKNPSEVIIAQPDFFMALGKLMKSQDLSTLKEYYKFHIISSFAPYLSKEIDNTNFDFYGKVLSGQKEQKPRWKRMLSSINGNIGEILGQVYVKKYFPASAKAKMLTLVKNLQKSYANRIQKLDWMSDDTKKEALNKLNSFQLKIGYPDKWKDYSKLNITPTSMIQNLLNASQFEYNENLSKLDKPVDKSEWFMTPQTVNAYYNPSFNEIVFPAAILQFPFFDEKADDAVNYGGIGAVIGHEMTHGFDDQGAQYAADGNLKNWWTSEDEEKFKAKTQQVVNQYNAYTVLDTVHVNGELTLGENIADLGGVCISYDAFKTASPSMTKIDGYTPDERFFMNWAQIWRANIRPEAALQRIMTDPHSPGIWRCNGPITNLDAWYNTFNINADDKMFVPAEKRIKIW